MLEMQYVQEETQNKPNMTINIKFAEDITWASLLKQVVETLQPLGYNLDESAVKALNSAIMEVSTDYVLRYNKTTVENWPFEGCL